MELNQSRYKQKKPTKARTFDSPNQTVNIDLCFVPVSHEPEVKLPAVSGSSGKLLVQREPREAKEWPGRVFEDESLSYEEAMNKFIETSQTENQQNKIPLSPEELAALDTRAKKQAIGRFDSALRVDRRQVREKRKAEDGAWKTIRELRAQEQARLEDSQVLTPQPAQKSPHTCDRQKTSATAFANRQLADDKAGYTQSATKVTPSNQKEIPATPRGANETQPTGMTPPPQALSEPSGALLSNVLTQTSQTTQAAQKEVVYIN